MLQSDQGYLHYNMHTKPTSKLPPLQSDRVLSHHLYANLGGKRIVTSQLLTMIFSLHTNDWMPAGRHFSPTG